MKDLSGLEFLKDFGSRDRIENIATSPILVLFRFKGGVEGVIKNGVSFGRECVDYIRADKTGTPGNENSHLDRTSA